jgi:hypothetical protein
MISIRSLLCLQQPDTIHNPESHKSNPHPRTSFTLGLKLRRSLGTIYSLIDGENVSSDDWKF